MNIYINKDAMYLGLNIGCAAINLYHSPTTFSLGFATGMALGLCLGIKYRISLLIIDYNKMAVDATTNKADVLTKSFQTKASDGLHALSESKVGKSTADLAGRVKPVTDKVGKIGKYIIDAYLYFSGYGGLISYFGSYFWGFNEQREKVLEKLNPIPGFKGTLISLTAVAANVGSITWPFFSQLWLVSGIPTGYAVGLSCMNWRLSNNEQTAEAQS